MKITADKLRALGACEEYVEQFEKLWPQGARVTRANVIMALNAGVPIDWLLNRLWPQSVYREYSEAVRQLYGEYDQRRSQLAAKYEAWRRGKGSPSEATVRKRDAEFTKLYEDCIAAEAALYVRYWNRPDLRIFDPR